MAGARVVGSICGDYADALAVCDLVQQVGQYGRVADPASGDLDGPDFQRFRIDPVVSLAPVPRLRRPVFLGQPLAIALSLHTGAVDQQVQGAGAGAIGDVDDQGLLAAAKGC